MRQLRRSSVQQRRRIAATSDEIDPDCPRCTVFYRPFRNASLFVVAGYTTALSNPASRGSSRTTSVTEPDLVG